MSIKDNYSRRVTFDTREELEDKIDKLAVMIGKLTARDNADQVDNLNLKFTKAKEEDSIEEIMIDVIMISKIIKTNIGQIVETEGSIDKIEVDHRYGQNIRGEKIRDNTRTYHNFERQSSRGEYRNNCRNESYSNRNRSRERSFSRNPDNRRNDRSMSNSQVQTRIKNKYK